MKKLENIVVPMGLPLDRGAEAGMEPGKIHLANESRFNSRYYSEPMTNYSVGFRDPNSIEDTLDFVFPPVQAPRKFEFKSAKNAEAFLSETDDVRAIGAEFKRVEFTGTTNLAKTINKGLTVRVDLDEVREIPNYQQNYTAMLLQRLLRNELRRGITVASAAANNTAKTWDTTAGKDPDQDILTDMIAGVDASGIRDNRILFGDVAWNKRGLSFRAQNNAGGYASSGMTPEQLAGFLGVDGIKISRERYQSSATAKTKVTPDIVLMFYGMNSPTNEDPCHFKRFWTPCEGGTKYRVYVQQISSKLLDITVEHYSNIVNVLTDGLRKLTIS